MIIEIGHFSLLLSFLLSFLTVIVAIFGTIAGADLIMLDNMSLEEMRDAVLLVNGKTPLECSGGVTLRREYYPQFLLRAHLKNLDCRLRRFYLLEEVFNTKDPKRLLKLCKTVKQIFGLMQLFWVVGKLKP